MNVARTVQILEDAGLAGLHVEDQVNPKRCGRHPDGVHHRVVLGPGAPRSRIISGSGATALKPLSPSQGVSCTNPCTKPVRDLQP
jgi:hypothetical protein